MGVRNSVSVILPMREGKRSGAGENSRNDSRRLRTLPSGAWFLTGCGTFNGAKCLNLTTANGVIAFCSGGVLVPAAGDYKGDGRGEKRFLYALSGGVNKQKRLVTLPHVDQKDGKKLDGGHASSVIGHFALVRITTLQRNKVVTTKRFNVSGNSLPLRWYSDGPGVRGEPEPYAADAHTRKTQRKKKGRR